MRLIRNSSAVLGALASPSSRAREEIDKVVALAIYRWIGIHAVIRHQNKCRAFCERRRLNRRPNTAHGLINLLERAEQCLRIPTHVSRVVIPGQQNVEITNIGIVEPQNEFAFKNFKKQLAHFKPHGPFIEPLFRTT